MSAATASTQSTGTLLDALEAIEPLVRQHSRQAEQQKHLSQPVVDALREAGFYRLFRPQVFGGHGLDPVTEFSLAEALAAIDAAAAWNVQVCNASELYGGWFGEQAAHEVFGSAGAIVAGSFSPRRRAQVVDDGYCVTGTTPFNSNCHGADWVLGLAEEYNGDQPRLDAHGMPTVLLTAIPTTECRIIDNWNTMGLAGTGSHDVDINDVFIPAARAVPFTPMVKPSPAYDTPLTRMAVWVTAGAHAAVAAGIARAAIDDLIALGSKVPAYTDSAICNRSRVQHRLALAEAKLSAAREFFHLAYRQAWESTLREGSLAMNMKGRCQLAATQVVLASAEAVDLVHSCVGTSGIRKEQNFEKYFRDVHVVTQHAFVSEARLEAVGQVMFGMEPDWPFFSF